MLLSERKRLCNTFQLIRMKHHLPPARINGPRSQLWQRVISFVVCERSTRPYYSFRRPFSEDSPLNTYVILTRQPAKHQKPWRLHPLAVVGLLSSFPFLSTAIIHNLPTSCACTPIGPEKQSKPLRLCGIIQFQWSPLQASAQQPHLKSFSLHRLRLGSLLRPHK